MGQHCHYANYTNASTSTSLTSKFSPTIKLIWEKHRSIEPHCKRINKNLSQNATTYLFHPPSPSRRKPYLLTRTLNPVSSHSKVESPARAGSQLAGAIEILATLP